jgi:hypothetical protein
MQNVEGGVVISIQHHPAFRAFVDSNGESFPFSRFTATPAANLTRSTRVHSDHSTRSFFRFRAEDCNELTPTRVMHTLGETHLAESVDVQIFNGNQIVLPHQTECGLEMEVAPSSLDLSMLASKVAIHVSPTSASPLSFVGSALSAFQHDFGNPQVSRISDSGSVTESSELRESNIDSDRFASGGKWHGRNAVATESHPPVTAAVAAKGDGLNASFNRAREKQPHSTNTAKGYSPSINLDASPQDAGQRVVAASRFESRMAAPFEKSGEGEINPRYRISKDDVRNGSNLGPIMANLRQLKELIEAGDSLPTHAPSLATFGQRSVVKLGAQGQLRFSISRNGRREFRLVFERLTHTSI